MPDGVVVKIVKTATVPSMEYCLTIKQQVVDFDKDNTNEFIKLVSVSCKETRSI